MNLFFDTSALVKFYHNEEGTEQVTELITSANNSIWLLDLARLEFVSALFRRYRNGELNNANLSIAIEEFDNDLVFLTSRQCHAHL